MGHGKYGEHENVQKVTSSLNIQKEIDNSSNFFKKLIMKQRNWIKNNNKKISPDQSPLKVFPTNTMTKNSI